MPQDYLIQRSLKNLFLLMLLTIYPCILHAQDLNYAEELIEKARKLSLASHQRWQVLLHYQSTKFSRTIKSLVDEKRFFNSFDGKTNAKSELAETIRSFFTDQEDGEHPQCLFPARYRWLKEMLHFDSGRLPERHCREFREWYSALKPIGITLIFPTTYINNPASTFGHTLLRFDRAEQDEKSRLLAYSANFAASTEGEDAFSYAIKGLFGGYQGLFSVQPYYKKVREYSDLENRDIWEYQLNFTLDEITDSVYHLWELRSVGFDYFYFDENCSFQLLALLDAARPSLNLSNQFPTWVIPVDTIRAILKEKGLLKKVTYRPSAATVLKDRIAYTDPSLYPISRDLATKETDITSKELLDLTEEEQAKALELAYDFHNYQMIKERKDTEEEKKRAFKLLTLRSKLDIDTIKLEVPTPEVRPEDGHKTSRLRITGGLTKEKDFWDLSYRTAYHDVLDPPAGYTTGAEINFMDIGLRQYEAESVKLERLIPLDILSLSPINYFQKPLSWDLQTGWERKSFSKDERSLTFKAGGGAGYTWKLFDELMLYSLLNIRFEHNTRYRNNLSSGIEPTLGLLLNRSNNWGIHLRISGARNWSETRNTYSFQAEQRISISKDLSLRVELSREYDFGYHDDQLLFSLDFYL